MGWFVLLRSSFCSCLLPSGRRIGRWCGIALALPSSGFLARNTVHHHHHCRGACLLFGWVGTCSFFCSADTAIISSTALDATVCEGVFSRLCTREYPITEADCFVHTRVYTQVPLEYLPGYPPKYVSGYPPEYIPGDPPEKFTRVPPEYIPGYPREYKHGYPECIPGYPFYPTKTPLSFCSCY